MFLLPCYIIINRYKFNLHLLSVILYGSHLIENSFYIELFNMSYVSLKTSSFHRGPLEDVAGSFDLKDSLNRF